MSYLLTPQQRNFFEVFGYLKIPRLFYDNISALQQGFDQLFEQHNALDWRHDAHYNKPRHIIFNAAEKHPLLRHLITCERMESLLGELLGDNYTYTASEANIFTGDTYWHSDLFGCHFKYRYVKALFYLDPLTANTGALCVIPGSHLFGDSYANKLQARIWEHEQHLGISKSDVPHIAIETQPGDVIFFDYRLKHATINITSSQRRMFTICGVERFQSEDEDKLLKCLLDGKNIGATIHTKAFLDSLTTKERYRIEQTLSLLESHKIQAY